jgi:hypothetical protein
MDRLPVYWEREAMRMWLTGTWLALALAMISGCGPKLSREELGEVIFQLPKVPPSQPAAPAQPAPPSE